MAVDKPEWIAEILLENRLYFALPSELNDPFECRINSDLTATLEEKKRYYFTKLQFQHGVSDEDACRLTEEWIETGEHEDLTYWQDEEQQIFCKARTEDFRVFCLTPHPDSLLMWSHYATSHKGICLRFENKDGIGSALKVSYVEDYPRVSFFYGSSRFEQMKAFVLTKSAVWRYEDEFRLLRIRGTNRNFPEHAGFDPLLLSGVILGAEMTPDQRKVVLDIAESRVTPVEVLEAHRAQYKFAVDIVPLDA